MNIFLLIIFVFFVSMTFYAIHLFLPTKKRYKYVICSAFILFGVCAWLSVWVGTGWLLSAVYGTAALFLGLILIIIAWLFDIYDKKNKQIDSEVR